jgi:hypothetical protein
MGKLTDANPNAKELLTESLDRSLWWSTLKVIVQFLHAKHVDQVRVEFEFVLDRDLEGKRQAQDQVVQLSDLESFITRSLGDGKIKWGRSDCFVYPVGASVAFMLCNDADVHFASADPSLLSELALKISSSGIKVYDSGQLV